MTDGNFRLGDYFRERRWYEKILVLGVSALIRKRDLIFGLKEC